MRKLAAALALLPLVACQEAAPPAQACAHPRLPLEAKTASKATGNADICARAWGSRLARAQAPFEKIIGAIAEECEGHLHTAVSLLKKEDPSFDEELQEAIETLVRKQVRHEATLAVLRVRAGECLEEADEDQVSNAATEDR